MSDLEITDSIFQIIQGQLLPVDAIVTEASAAFEMAQDRALLNAAGPLDRVLRYLREDLLPVLRSHEKHFEALVVNAIASATIKLQMAKDDVLSKTVALDHDCRAYVNAMVAEGFAGPETARVLIVYGTLDAISKLADQGLLSGYSALSYTDLLMITLAYLRFKADLISRS